METELCAFYVPIGSKEDALKISRELLEKKFIVCANVIGPVESLYLSAGEVQQDQEWTLVLKTLSSKTEELKRELLATHPYEIPCVLELGVNSVNSSYAQWARTHIL